MKKVNVIGIFLVILSVSILSCKERKVTRTDTPESGVAQIVSDESFAPVIQEQVDMFEKTYPEATVIPIYTSESEAFNLFMSDSIRVIIATRDLTAKEQDVIKGRNQLARSQKLAVDGIALIVNKQNADTLISVPTLKKIMTGKLRSWKDVNPHSTLGDINVVFDSPNSSTVRFIKDSICGGESLGDNVKARSEDKQATSDIKDKTPNQKVIDFVASTPNALGVIGVNWISNDADSTNLSFINNIRVMSVGSSDPVTSDNSFKPFPAFLALKKYPLTRDIFIIITDVRGGLPSGFVSFAAGDIGQRIILKAGLLPATAPIRVIRVNADQ